MTTRPKELAPLLDMLVDPLTCGPLRREGDELVSPTARYAIRDGIPRFHTEVGEDQAQTSDAFGFKWGKTESYETPEVVEVERNWMMTHHGYASAAECRAHLEAHSPVLDLGCGSGMGTSLWMDGWSGKPWVGVDISSAIDIAKRRLGDYPGTYFVQADLMALPFRPGTFPMVTSEGVLHHTPSTRAAIAAGAAMLAPGGEFQFYVYRKKSPIREFTDDYVRARIADMPPEEAWEALRPLTKLGQALAGLHATVDVPEAVDLLEIPAGPQDVQRLIYWHMAKLFWNDDLAFEANHHINFDWYAPRYANRQSEAELREWCAELGLEITWFHEEQSGYTVHARRPA